MTFKEKKQRIEHKKEEAERKEKIKGKKIGK